MRKIKFTEENWIDYNHTGGKGEFIGVYVSNSRGDNFRKYWIDTASYTPYEDYDDDDCVYSWFDLRAMRLIEKNFAEIRSLDYFSDFEVQFYTDNKHIVVGEVVSYWGFPLPKKLRKLLKAKAKCHPDDKFDYEAGKKLVLERLGMNETAICHNPENRELKPNIILDPVTKAAIALGKMPNTINHFILLTELSETYHQKNKAYGDSFQKSVEKYGLTSALTRMSDKWNRIENLIMKDVPHGDESLRDSLMDMANYCLMTVMVIDDKAESSKESH